jgi:hypothetical protein
MEIWLCLIPDLFHTSFLSFPSPFIDRLLLYFHVNWPHFQISSEIKWEVSSRFFFSCQLSVADRVAISCQFYETVRTYLVTLPISSFRTLWSGSFCCSVFCSLLGHPHRPQLQLKSPCEIENSAPWCIYIWRKTSPHPWISVILYTRSLCNKTITKKLKMEFKKIYISLSHTIHTWVNLHRDRGHTASCCCL